MTALPTLCLPSHAISLRRSCTVLGQVPFKDSERMHASTLSLATSIPTTMRSFCAIIQFPSLLGPGSKPMQLFGLRKTPDLSLAPRQALVALRTKRAQIQRRAVLQEPPVRTFWQNLRTQEREISRKTIARGMPGVSGVTVVTNARVYYTPRAAAGASGARHSLRPRIRGREVLSKTRAKQAARSRSCVPRSSCPANGSRECATDDRP